MATYVVKGNDTFYNIATRFHGDKSRKAYQEELIALNNGKLNKGATIKLPSSKKDATKKVIKQHAKNKSGKTIPQTVKSNCKSKKVCSYLSQKRSIFVLHSTASKMTKKRIFANAIVKKTKKRSTNRAHIYIMEDGSRVVLWPLSKKYVGATKRDTYKAYGKSKYLGKMFHIEINYASGGKPSTKQYYTLAELYMEASQLVCCWPWIVPHIEIDRGIPDPHKDPENFDYNFFYDILKTKGVPILKIKKFSHNRYWGHKSYKMPWPNDKNSWPPVLTGNPHK